MPRIIEKTVYQYEELSEEAKERAREWYREGGFDYEWWDFVFEDVDQVARLLGIEIDRKSVPLMNGQTRQDPAIYFSGFSSQGDGACFEGYYAFRQGAYTDVKAHAPKDGELRAIARDLNIIQRRSFYRLSARVRHTGHYNHEFSTTIEVENAEDSSYNVSREEERGIIDCLRAFMRWIYKSLQEAWDWLNSDEQVEESIKANEYEFDEEGRRV